MDLIEFFKDPRFVSQWYYNWDTKEPDMIFPQQRHFMIMKDGLGMSVQASEYHYCCPRRNLEIGIEDYFEYEVGFPTEKVPQFMEFAENPEEPTSTVYGYVPLDVIQEVICLHGGIDIEATLAKIEEKKQKQLENKQ